MDQNRLREALGFARLKLVEAGEIALRYFRQPLVIDNKLAGDAFDPVTRADREVESFLRAELTRGYPEIGVIGEEQGAVAGTSGLDWVIDPIDGTKAFISGLPTWGMLLGLKRDRQVLGGMMYQPFTRELFCGGPDGARWLRGESEQILKTRREGGLDEAILYCTHENMFTDPTHLAAFRKVSARVRLQRFGADCYAYCMLALGLVDLVIEDTLQPYDIVPLIPIVEAAGGVVSGPHGESPVDGGFVVAAAHRDLHAEALDLLAL